MLRAISFLLLCGSLACPTSRVPSGSPRDLFVLPDAIRILGEAAHLADSTTTREDKSLRYLCTFKADQEDPSSGKMGAIYFLYEKFDQVADAQKRYSSTKTGTERNGIEPIDQLGDEAYFHTDHENFYFTMVRKGNVVLSVKVNKITSKTSLPLFDETVRRIAGSL